MLHFIFRLGALCIAMLSLSAWAATPAETIRQGFHKSRPDIQVENVKPSEVKGLYEVRLKDGPTVYATEDGKFFLTGDLFNLFVSCEVMLTASYVLLTRTTLASGVPILWRMLAMLWQGLKPMCLQRAYTGWAWRAASVHLPPV